MQDNLTGEDLEDILEELATVIDLADERDQQTTESLQVVTLHGRQQNCTIEWPRVYY